mgnify:FL=1
MTDLLTLALFWGFCCAVIGVAVVNVMGSDDTPLSWYFRWAFAWQERGGWRSWIASPLGGCVMCTSGQLALWSHFAMINGSWFLHLLAGCSGVLCAFTINKAYRWLNNKM